MHISFSSSTAENDAAVQWFDHIDTVSCIMIHEGRCGFQNKKSYCTNVRERISNLT